MKAHRINETQVAIHCPGCGENHAIDSRWTFNGNFERPTFTPSLLIRSGHYVPGVAAVGTCWCTYNAEQIAKGEPPAPFVCTICHSFITDGRIQFLGDCTHALKAQTVDLPAWRSTAAQEEAP